MLLCSNLSYINWLEFWCIERNFNKCKVYLYNWRDDIYIGFYMIIKVENIIYVYCDNCLRWYKN